MSTFGFLPGSSMIFGFRVWRIWNESVAADLSAIFMPGLSFRFPSSFRTSWGTSHSVF